MSAAAEELAEVGRYHESASLLLDATRATPDEAAIHRELARVGQALADWGGCFVGESRAFRSLAELAAERPGDPLAADPITVARRAIERAVELRPDSVAWLAPLGELREADGDLRGAIEAFEAAVAGTAGSHSAWVTTSRHLWQFQLERAHHRAGSPRVDDPLFDAQLLPVASSGDGGEQLPAGLFQVRFTHQGLRISGVVEAEDVQNVDLWLDEEKVRRINVPRGRAPRRFDSVLRRAVLDVAPRLSRLEVRTQDGRRLLIGGRHRAVEVHLPRASGRLRSLLADGVRIDKKGGLTPTAADVAVRQDALLRLYDEVRAFLARELDRDLFVMYGTLLGVHRQGDLIPGDDDFDCGYVAHASDPAATKADAIGLIEALVRGGFSVSVNRRGRLFRVHHEAIGDASIHLDVHPVWFEGSDLYVHNHHRFPARVEDLLPTVDRPLRGGTVLVPRRPEVLLERFYGPGWRTPDPGYVDDSSGAPDEVMRRLGEALITPDEQRELLARLSTSLDGNPPRGRLVFIATQPLYPLDALVE